MNIPLALFHIMMIGIYAFNFYRNTKEHDFILTTLECSFITLEIITVLYLLEVAK